MTDTRAGRPGTISGAEFAGIGLQFAASLLLFVFAGIWLDRRLRTTWVFTVLGTFLGAGGAFYSMYRRVIAAQRREREQTRQGGFGPRDGAENSERRSGK